MIKMQKIKKNIRYWGKTLYFRQEVDSVDEADALLKWYRKEGNTAAATHKNGKHQIYSDIKRAQFPV